MTNDLVRRPIIYAILLALLISVCFTLLAGCGGGGKANDTTPGAVTTPTPTTDAATTTEEPEATTTTAEATTPEMTTPESTAAQTTEPVTTTAETTTAKAPETTAPPAPFATSGSFKMETGTTLGYRLDWSLDRFEDGFAYIDIKVILTTYELYISARRNLGIINFGEETIRFSTDRISYSGKKPIEIILTVVQVAIPADGDIAVAYVEGEWFFNASYANVEYDWLSVGGYVCVQKPV